MQPGKPQGFGIVGEDGTPIFTLPGNPVSSYVSFEMFVLPAIRKMMGQHAVLPADDAGPGSPTALSSPDGRRQFVRGSLRGRRAAARVTPVGGHGSHLIGDLAASNALIVVPEDVTVGRGRRAGAGAAARRGVLMAEPGPDRLTHVDESGAARMVDVSGKDVTARTATASGRVLVSAEVVALLRGEGVPKGDALAVARLAGIMGAKQTPALIPLCHPLAISGGHRRPRPSPTTPSRSPPPCAPPTAPASRWRR